MRVDENTDRTDGHPLKIEAAQDRSDVLRRYATGAFREDESERISAELNRERGVFVARQAANFDEGRRWRGYGRRRLRIHRSIRSTAPGETHGDLPNAEKLRDALPHVVPAH